MNNNQPIIVFTFAVVIILCGTLGLVLLCFGSIAIPASIFAGEQINFLGQENPRTALVAGAVAVVVGIILVAIAIYVVLSILSRRDDRDVVARYEPFESEEDF